MGGWVWVIMFLSPVYHFDEICTPPPSNTNNQKKNLKVYNANYTSQVKLDNYDMALAPGRSYRYYTGEPLFKYGK